jgi:hypothetical protein
VQGDFEGAVNPFTNNPAFLSERFFFASFTPFEGKQKPFTAVGEKVGFHLLC